MTEVSVLSDATVHAPSNFVVDPAPGVAPASAADADPWDEGRAAARAGDHARALELFSREARRRTTEGGARPRRHRLPRGR